MDGEHGIDSVHTYHTYSENYLATRSKPNLGLHQGQTELLGLEDALIHLLHSCLGLHY